MERVLVPIREDRFDNRYWLRSESTNNDVAIQFTVDGKGSALVPGAIGEAFIPFNGRITGWRILSQTVADAEIDVWKSPDTAYPPNETNSITSGNNPQLVAGQVASSDNTSLWDRDVLSGDVVRVQLVSATNVFYLTVVLYLNRPGVLTSQLAELDQKADIDHNHDGVYAPLVHDHNSLYYTEPEVDALFAGAGATHNHDDRYFTEDEVTSLLAGKAPVSHTHIVTDISATGTASASTYLRGDGAWQTPPDTTYTAITQAEAENSASTTARLVTGQRLAQAVAKFDPKTFNDDAFLIRAAADATRMARFAVGSITAGQTRQITVQDKAGTMSLVEDTNHVPTGGATNDTLVKKSGAAYDTGWLPLRPIILQSGRATGLGSKSAPFDATTVTSEIPAGTYSVLGWGHFEAEGTTAGGTPGWLGILQNGTEIMSTRITYEQGVNASYPVFVSASLTLGTPTSVTYTLRCTVDSGTMTTIDGILVMLLYRTA